MKNETTIIAIDPGVTGAIIVMTNGEFIEAFPMPNRKASVGSEINYELLSLIVKDIAYNNNVSMVVIEDVHSLHQASKQSNFKFGENYGIIKGIIAANNLPMTKILPKEWQKKAWKGVPVLKKTDGSKDTKAMSLFAFNNIFPNDKQKTLVTKRSRVPHDGVVDAALIGYSVF